MNRPSRAAQAQQTARLRGSLPLQPVRRHTSKSGLKPDTHILPHRGVTHTRLVTHLPLIIPENYALHVSGELHV